MGGSGFFAMAKLEARGLVKRFGRIAAVQDVTFSVEERELFALLGPSGCGKTTVLRLIAGLIAPDAGRVFIDGADVTALPPERRGVGMVFQSYALFPHLSVAGNVAYGLRFARLPRRERARRVRELLALMELSGYERRRVYELSQGQRQRVALARALAPRPRVLLLDEPLSALDAALRLELRGQLRRLQNELGITAVHVTHDQEEALAIADRLGVMRAGKLVEVGTPQGLYREPRTPFVAGFLGQANLWPAAVEEVVDAGIWVDVAGIRMLARGKGLSPGERGFLFSRPEDITAGEGPYQAVVEASEYLGDRWKVQAVFVGCPLTVYAPGPIRPGAMIKFGFSRPPRFLPPEEDEPVQ